MTLHEAITKVINESTKVTMSASEIADVVNQKKYYIKKDESLIAASQISARVKNYKELFKKVGSQISLLDASVIAKANALKTPSTKLLSVSSGGLNTSDWSLLEKMLLNVNNFKDCNQSENAIPDKPGIYCIRVKNLESFPENFAQELKVRNHNIIYLGIASKSLKKRFFNQELRAKGHGTFFRSIGAVLHFRPLKGSLSEKANKRNYKFTPEDEKKIINWIDNNLIVNWIEMSENLNEFETHIILKYKPLLNISKNTAAVPELSAIRAECVRIANDC